MDSARCTNARAHTYTQPQEASTFNSASRDTRTSQRTPAWLRPHARTDPFPVSHRRKRLVNNTSRSDTAGASLLAAVRRERASTFSVRTSSSSPCLFVLRDLEMAESRDQSDNSGLRTRVLPH